MSEISFKEIAYGFWFSVESMREYAKLVPVAEANITQAVVEFEQRNQDLFEIGAIMAATKELGAASLAEALDPDTIISAVDPNTQKRIESLEPSRFIVALRGIEDILVKSVAHELVPRSAFISLESSFEMLLADVTRQYYILRPEALSGDDKILSFNELKAFGDLSHAINYIVSHKVDDLLRKNYDDWRKFLTSRLNIDPADLTLTNWGDLVELFERRNIVVHNDGRANAIYLNKVREHISPERLPKDGDRLGVPVEYLLEAVRHFKVLGLRLVDSCWAKLDKRDAELRDRVFSDFVFKSVLTGEWGVARSLSAHALKRGADTTYRQMIYQMNYWLAQKRLGHWGEVKDAVHAFDTNACNPVIAVAVHSLREDSTAFYKVLPAAVASGLSRFNLLDWPILEEMRQTAEFNEMMGRLFADHVGEQTGVKSLV